MRPTVKYELIQDRLGQDLRGYLLQLHEARLSYPAISRLIKQQTGVAITSQTVRLWVRELVGTAA